MRINFQNTIRRVRWSIKWKLGTILPALLISAATQAKTSDISSRVEAIKQKAPKNGIESAISNEKDSPTRLQFGWNNWVNWSNWSNWNNWNNWKNWNNFDNWQKFSNVTQPPLIPQ